MWDDSERARVLTMRGLVGAGMQAGVLHIVRWGESSSRGGLATTQAECHLICGNGWWCLRGAHDDV